MKKFVKLIKALFVTNKVKIINIVTAKMKCVYEL